MAWLVRAYLNKGEERLTICKLETFKNVKSTVKKYLKDGFNITKEERPKTVIFYPARIIYKIDTIEIEEKGG